MRAVADVPDRLVRTGRLVMLHRLPFQMRSGQRYVTELPAKTADGTMWVWRLGYVQPDAGRASARIVSIGDRQILVLDRTSAVQSVAIEVTGDSSGHAIGGVRRWQGLIRERVGTPSPQPGAWVVPDVIAPAGGEMCLDPHVLTVRPGASSPAWVHAWSSLTGQLYFSFDVHVYAPGAAGSPWAAVGVMDASALAARTLPGDGPSVAARRTGTTSMQIWRDGVAVDGHVTLGVHRRVDVRVDVPSRSVWMRSTAPYTWSGPWTVPGTGALHAVAYLDPAVVGFVRLVTSASDLTWHADYPPGFASGWVDP